MNQDCELFIISIYNDSNKEIDIKDILKGLGLELVQHLFWGIERLDCVGVKVQEFCDEVNTAPNSRLVIPGERLISLAEDFIQTIDGVFVGYGSIEASQEFLDKQWQLGQFRESKALMVIKSIEASVFDVYLCSQEIFYNLSNQFANTIHRQNLEDYF